MTDLNTFLLLHREGLNPSELSISKFNYFDFEKKIINHITKYRFSIIKKARQMHITNLLEYYVAWNLLYNEEEKNQDITYFGINNKTCIKFKNSVIRILYKFIDEDDIITNKKDYIKLKSGNSLSTLCVSPDATCGYSHVNTKIIILDEFAFWGVDNQRMLEALYPTLGENTHIIIASTPNGKETFRKIYKKAKKGKNIFKHLYLPYYMNPLWTDERIEETKRILSKERFKSEIEAKFVKPKKPKKIKK